MMNIIIFYDGHFEEGKKENDAEINIRSTCRIEKKECFAISLVSVSSVHFYSRCGSSHIYFDHFPMRNALKFLPLPPPKVTQHLLHAFYSFDFSFFLLLVLCL